MIEREFLSIRALAETLASLEEEKEIRVICKARPKCDMYLENMDNRANLPSSAKLEALGWQCRYGAEKGFRQVLRFLRESQ